MRLFTVILTSVVLTGCVGGDVPVRDAAGSQAARPAIQRTLVLVALQLPNSFAAPQLVGAVSGRAINIPATIFNSTLSIADESAQVLPFLAETLPRLNSDTWRVFPDGTMETVYRLRPNLTWHDGQPLTADDFVFAWQVYASPEYGVSTVVPMNYITAVEAPDARTVLIKWNERYVEAGTLQTGLPPLPRHLLEAQQNRSKGTGPSSPDFLPNSSFWTEDYVGAGPYKLESVNPGVSIEALAFDAFVLGRPKINRVSVRGIEDPNAALAALLAGEVHFSFGQLSGETADIFAERAGTTGVVLWEPTLSRALDIQFRPDRAQPLELATDVRVRKALYHALDRQAIFDAVENGHGLLTPNTYMPPGNAIYAAVDAAVTKYPFDQRRAIQYLEEAGFRRGANGQWSTPRGSPFDLPVSYTTGATNFAQENAIQVDQFKQIGIAATPNPFNTAGLDAMARALLPGLNATNGGSSTGFTTYISSLIPTAENRWSGGNRNGWSSPEMDRLVDAFRTELNTEERVRLTIQIEKIMKDELPTLFMYFTSRPNAHVAALRGPVNCWGDGFGAIGRNIHEWYWES